jgi:O-methyltransferase
MSAASLVTSTGMPRSGIRRMTDSPLIFPTFPHGRPGLRPDGDGVVLMHPTTGLEYRFNATAQAIWEGVQEPTSVAAVRERVSRMFDVGEDEAHDAVTALVEHLSELGLVEIRAGGAEEALRLRYLGLLERALVNLIYPEHELRMDALENAAASATERAARERELRDIRESDPAEFAALVAAKLDGKVHHGRPCRYSHTMVGLRRLQHLHWCAQRVFADGVPGDFLEAGVCQGGAAIYMRALQVAYGEAHRLLWAADSFEGLPVPEHEKDDGYDFSEAQQPWLAASLESVRENFRTYDLLSDAVRFLPGWFSDSLPHAPVGELAILRLDADLYASTMDALVPLYDKVAPGGFVVVDDYWAFTPCRKAITEFRETHGITEPIRRIDWSAVYWRKRR